MSEDKKQDQTAIESEEVVGEQQAADWLLEMLVELSNKGMTLPITLFVNGIIIAGTLTGGGDYFSRIADQFAVGDTELSKPFADSLRQIGNTVYSRLAVGHDGEERAEEKAEEGSREGRQRSPVCIHLKDARIYHPGAPPLPGGPGVWWRGRLESVDGFIFGVPQID